MDLKELPRTALHVQWRLLRLPLTVFETVTGKDDRTASRTQAEARQGLVENVLGKAKEAVGIVMGDDRLTAAGQVQQAKGEELREAAANEAIARQQRERAEQEFAQEERELRRRKAEVAPELPPRIEVELRCELTPEQRELYETVLAATRRDVLGRLAQGGNVLEALEALLRLRQAACHPALVPGSGGGRSGKLEVLLESLEEGRAEGHRALVFSQWTSFLDLIEPSLRDAGIETLRLDGSTRDRGAVVADFQRDGGPPVMLLSLKAGGTGLNLTAADHVFLLDPWWNPAVEAQAADRAHRIGQDRPVFVHRLVSLGTVEERILLLQDQKRALFEAALGDGGAASGLTREDLLALLV